MTTTLAERPTRRPNRTYGSLEKDQAMTLYATTGGAKEATERLLEEYSLDIPIETIKTWVYRSEKDRYARINGEVQQHLRLQLLDLAIQGAHLTGEVSRTAYEEIKRRLNEDATGIDARELVKVAQGATVGYGIYSDKFRELSGQPARTAIIEVAGVLRELKDMGIEITIDGDAESEPVLKVEAEVQEIGSGDG